MTGGSEALVRLGIFIGVFAALACVEYFFPFRRDIEWRVRWLSNLGLSLLNTLLLRGVALAVPVLSVAAAASFEGRGVLALTGVQGLSAAVIGFIALDFAIYVQHAVFHRVALFWRFHCVHHSDISVDVTTAVRFHPVEMLISLLWKLAVVSVLGVPLVAVIVFEAVLNASSMFSHSNFALPAGIDRGVRLIFVTPHMHRIHHSTKSDEMNSNYGFNFSIWDRWFGSYRADGVEDQSQMSFGIAELRPPARALFGWLIHLPFRRNAAL